MWMRNIFILIATFFILTFSAGKACAELEWIPSAERPCPEICMEKGKFPIPSGQHTNGNIYYVCAAHLEGYRPGYNLAGKWSTICGVGHAGDEKMVRKYNCLCSSDPLTLD
jgi:hypothetical protein